jgi:flavodoxin
MKELIVYFSRPDENYIVGYISKGNTEVIADYIKELTDADIFKIEPKVLYPAEYKECLKISKKELEGNARPELIRFIDSIDEYNVIYLGYPNWWSDMPMCVYTFLDHYNFTGKTIKPFCTHEGNGLSNTVEILRKYLPEATITEGLAIRGKDVYEAKEIVAEWLAN